MLLVGIICDYFGALSYVYSSSNKCLSARKMSDFGYERRRESDWHDDSRDEEEEMENRGRNRNARSGTLVRMDSIQDPGKRYALKDRIGAGAYGDVYEGIDQQAGKQ